MMEIAQNSGYCGLRNAGLSSYEILRIAGIQKLLNLLFCVHELEYIRLRIDGQYVCVATSKLCVGA